MLVTAIADCEQEVSQRAAVQVVTCVAGVQQSNLTAAVQSGILKVSKGLFMRWYMAFCRGHQAGAKPLKAEHSCLQEGMCRDAVQTGSSTDAGGAARPACEASMGAAHDELAASLHL